MTEPIAFNPFNHVLAEDERYRIVDGKLTVEKSEERVKSSGWHQFWTRGQYSQSAILEEMGKLYRATKQEQSELHINDTFLENYKTLVGRAIEQNVSCSKMNSIARFFNAKSKINLDGAYKQINDLSNDLEADMQRLIEYKISLTRSAVPDNIRAEFQAEKENPWWQGQELTEKDSIIFDAVEQPPALLDANLLLRPLGREAKNATDGLDLILKAFGMDTLKGIWDKKINGPHHLDHYLLKHQIALIKKLNDLKL